MHGEEGSPLLQDDTESVVVEDHEAVYDRFSVRTKRMILALVSWSAILPLFASGIFIPTIPQIAKDLNSDAQTITMAVSLSIFCSATGSLVAAVYSSFYGRRAAYLVGTPLLFIGSMGVAFSQSVSTMLAFCCVQAFGTSGGMSVGGAIIGDIYKLTERGTAMGIFFGASFFGPALAPLVGGWGAHYASWRLTQFYLGIVSLLTCLLMFFFLPETSHPGSRGIELVWASSNSDRRPFKWVWLNPLKSLHLMRSPVLMLMVFASLCSVLADYVMLVPLAYTIGERYNIHNEFIIGACFLPAGLGNTIGAPLSGYLSDIHIIRARKKYGKDAWYPEERLRAALVAASIPLPLSLLASGYLITYVPGPIGLTLNLLCFFVNGIAVDVVLTPISAYCVDILHSHSAEVMACTMAIRSILLSLGTALIIPGIKSIGVLETNAVTAGFSWLGFLVLMITIKKGPAMREWLDVGYTRAKEA
ncbi:MFS general substrate transporter [Cylindrobasidium torrendii FP15055 ss-10]|uniref:MFS general substrate transporter n=1 Tax=Cylindrobasidium torrendii FP15055 ss-10 TaxID=1314674 RepID=A0A0D7BHC1_9AGAR|nr:MFS general substrate transporter [Cylindrobasidium torrendii FP15055 ss-10]